MGWDNYLAEGSSPRMRGARILGKPMKLRRRIIPADAGSTKNNK